MSGPASKIMNGREKVRVCLAQIAPAYMDRDATLAKAGDAIREASANGAELIVFPEVWLAGYPYWSEGWDSDLRTWAGARTRFFDEAVLVPGPVSEEIGRMAAAHNMHVVIGCNELDPRPGVQTIYNSLLYFDSNGALLGRHRKLMPTFSERMFWGQGDGSDLETYDTQIGRIGGLICGENLMTPLRAATIAMGEDFHVAVFPGAFALHTGPRLEEWDMSGNFWGHFVTRAHAMEAGAFTLAVCAYIDPDEIAEDFPARDALHFDYARGGSQVVNPLGVPMAGPVEGSEMIYADCEAWMIKAVKAICDTAGHYSRPDVVQTILRRDDQWQLAGEKYRGGREEPLALDGGELRRHADRYEIEEDVVRAISDESQLRIGKS